LARLGLAQKEVLAIRQRQALEADELSGRSGDRRAIETQERESGKRNEVVAFLIVAV